MSITNRKSNTEIKEAVQEQNKAGFSKDEIIENLINDGFSKDEIEPFLKNASNYNSYSRQGMNMFLITSSIVFILLRDYFGLVAIIISVFFFVLFLLCVSKIFPFK